MVESGDAAKSIVVDQLSNLLVRSADLAVRVLLQLDGIERHIQGVIEQKPPNQAGTDPQQQLDGFGGLDRADRPGQDAQHTAFSARRYQTRRRRLGEQAAVTRAFFGIKDTGLAFEAVY